MTLTAPPSASGKVYAEYDFASTISISNHTDLILKVSAQGSGSTSGVYIMFNSGKSVLETFAGPSVYAVDLSQFAGEQPTFMLLYVFLPQVAAGTDVSYSVSYGWIMLANG